MEVDYNVSLIINNLFLTQWTMEADYKIPLIANNLHLSE